MAEQVHSLHILITSLFHYLCWARGEVELLLKVGCKNLMPIEDQGQLLSMSLIYILNGAISLSFKGPDASSLVDHVVSGAPTPAATIM